MAPVLSYKKYPLKPLAVDLVLLRPDWRTGNSIHLGPVTFWITPDHNGDEFKYLIPPKKHGSRDCSLHIEAVTEWTVILAIFQILNTPCYHEFQHIFRSKLVDLRFRMHNRDHGKTWYLQERTDMTAFSLPSFLFFSESILRTRASSLQPSASETVCY